MRRSGPPQRKAPLRSGDKPLARSKGMARTGPPPRRQQDPRPPPSTRPRRRSIARTPTADPVTPDTRAEVQRRSGGYCEARVTRACTGVAVHVHHRKLRRHGDHRPVNLMHVCLVCHDRIHARPQRSYDHGWLVRGADNPEEVPVLAPGAAYP